MPSTSTESTRKRPRAQQQQQNKGDGERNRWYEEFILGGASTATACLFSNPFDVVKTRMQLQGELKGKGTYQRHYRNVFHAALTIAQKEGLLALQKGLGPALVYQFVMNGVRLGTYQTLVNMGFTKPKEKGKPPGKGAAGEYKRSDFIRSVIAGAMGGGIGGIVASPLYLVSLYINIVYHNNVCMPCPCLPVR